MRKRYGIEEYIFLNSQTLKEPQMFHGNLDKSLETSVPVTLVTLDIALNLSGQQPLYLKIQIKWMAQSKLQHLENQT